MGVGSQSTAELFDVLTGQLGKWVHIEVVVELV